jgi:hypothetical protein
MKIISLIMNDFTYITFIFTSILLTVDFPEKFLAHLEACSFKEFICNHFFHLKEKGLFLKNDLYDYV